MSKVITPEAIISYPHVFEPQTPPGASEPVYSCCLVFLDGTDMSELKATAAAVAKEKWGDKTKALMESVCLSATMAKRRATLKGRSL
jgi:hypothetical protein